MTLTSRRGREIPFFVTDYTYEDISTADFDPITTKRDGHNVASDMNDSRLGEYKKGGFIVKPNADGLIYMITLDSYLKNRSSLTGLVPQEHIGVTGVWIECPVVKVYAADDGSYPSACDAINVALV